MIITSNIVSYISFPFKNYQLTESVASLLWTHVSSPPETDIQFATMWKSYDNDTSNPLNPGDQLASLSCDHSHTITFCVPPKVYIPVLVQNSFNQTVSFRNYRQSIT